MRGISFLKRQASVSLAEAALRRASDQPELEDIWFESCDQYADDTPERKHLLGVYMERTRQFKAAEAVARMMRV